MSAQCPECGFDLEPGKACRVCGYQPRSAGPGAPGSQGVKVPSARPGSRGSVGVLIASAAGLLVVLAVFIIVDIGGRASDSDQPAAHITAAVPAPAPKPVSPPAVRPGRRARARALRTADSPPALPSPPAPAVPAPVKPRCSPPCPSPRPRALFMLPRQCLLRHR